MNKSHRPGLYIHVPFCRTKCPYCDFYSVTSGEHHTGAWLKALEQEVQFYQNRFAAFDSIYIGGGTPSLLNREEISGLMDCLSGRFRFFSDTEVTLEANPDDITPEKLSLYRRIGINRISLGVQSFQENEVAFMQRRHTAKEAERALEFIRSAGFTNIGIDLIYGFEGQTESGWIQTLERALRFRPEHLSCYQMTIEEGTPFGKMKAEGKLRSLGEEEEGRFFSLTSSFLKERGYIHYEISNFARGPEYFSRHNQKYWNHTPYLGLGPAAHSFQNGVRWWNVRSLQAYCQMLARKKTPVENREVLTREQLRLEALYLGFRTEEGVDFDIVREFPGAEGVLAELEKSGLIVLKKGRVAPTQQGFLVADSLPILFVS
ncbi:MAG: radical SAM family heme chaperone HemW [Deltaproteobacteria bacterium]|jgi:oxygen-independent coproporphyrinogen-3 oxidase|nr:radical SAM family heme chaperone HemW [Deltaproteobacteria bacterium]